MFGALSVHSESAQQRRRQLRAAVEGQRLQSTAHLQQCSRSARAVPPQHSRKAHAVSTAHVNWATHAAGAVHWLPQVRTYVVCHTHLMMCLACRVFTASSAPYAEAEAARRRSHRRTPPVQARRAPASAPCAQRRSDRPSLQGSHCRREQSSVTMRTRARCVGSVGSNIAWASHAVHL